MVESRGDLAVRKGARRSEEVATDQVATPYAAVKTTVPIPKKRDAASNSLRNLPMCNMMRLD